MNQSLDKAAETEVVSNLTQTQLMIWTGQIISPDSPHYNMILTFYLDHDINASIFSQAFQMVIDHCDTLKTVIREEHGIPLQHILDKYIYQTELIDLSEIGNTPGLFEKWLDQNNRQVFALDQPMFNSKLIKTGPERYVWYLNQHHLITDAWSVGIVYDACLRVYMQLSEGKNPEPVLLPHFQKYRAYESKARNSNEALKAKAFWCQKFDHFPKTPAFYGVKAGLPSTESERISIKLGKSRSQALFEIAKEVDLFIWNKDLSLFNIFTCLLFSYLYRVSGQQDLIIGAPAHNRTTSGFKNTPGCFIEFFPIRITLLDQDTFGSLCQRTRDAIFDFLKYGRTGISTPDLNRSFSVVLNYINASFSKPDDLQVKSKWIHSGHSDPGHHLRLHVHDFDATGEINLDFDFNSKAFPDQARIDAPLQFVKLIDSFIEDRSQLIDFPPLIDWKEMSPPDDYSGDAFEMGQSEGSILQKFSANVKKNPDAVALIFDGHKTTFGQLNRNANRLAANLRKLGLEHDERVALLMKRTPALIEAILAVWKLGATYIPIDPKHGISWAKEIVEDSLVRGIITDQDQTGGLENGPHWLLTVDHKGDQADLSGADEDLSDRSQSELAYIIYTSGSSGKPKGVMIPQPALSNYIEWAAGVYITEPPFSVALCTSIGFDLTVTSLFLPLAFGGTMVIYEERESTPALDILRVIRENEVDFIKLTPSHLSFLVGENLKSSQLKTIVVGGEDFKADLAARIVQSFGREVIIYNEYGPTEATVGCIVHQYDGDLSVGSVPIGRPIAKTGAYVLDKVLNPVPVGVTGELYLAGRGLAKGYWQKPELTSASFLNIPQLSDTRLYRTGDLVREGFDHELHFLGRADDQVKVGGIRVEPGEIENALQKHPEIDSVIVVSKVLTVKNADAQHCSQCGLSSNYPGITFNEEGVCSLCLSFTSYQERVKAYFKDIHSLKKIIMGASKDANRSYDCIMLLSGGKDSTYALAKLVEMGCRVLAFTLDNGYISDQAKANIRRVVTALEVDHIFGSTPSMNEIFVDSLKRFSNVCDGCFKTLYTLSFKVALEKEIPFIITGLSRGQFFETRLSEELFWNDTVGSDQIDQIILDARKIYHQADDAVKKLLDVSFLEKEDVFEQVKFLDFYRFTDVSLDEMLDYLDTKLPWIRPTDTGRSTNCLINKAGIYVHRKERGYSNYAFPYSWDVRIGHKTREASLAEINEEINEEEVSEILDEIGYAGMLDHDKSENALIAYYVSKIPISQRELTGHCNHLLPTHMVPEQFVAMSAFPLTVNGKIDREALPLPSSSHHEAIGDTVYEAPGSAVEKLISEIWSEVLRLEKIGVNDRFIDLGGSSLAAIRIVSRINHKLHLDLPVTVVFENPTIRALANIIDETIKKLLAKVQ